VSDGCEPCLRIHGPGCKASYRDETGKRVCVFCADGIACPVQIRILKETRARNPKEDEMNGTEKTTSPVSLSAASLPAAKSTENTPSTRKANGHAAKASPSSPAHKRTASAPATLRTCEECPRRLSYNNKTGKCKEHSERDRRGSNPQAARPPAARNGSKKSNAHRNDQDLAIAERVDLVLAAIPLEAKVRMISDWLGC